MDNFKLACFIVRFSSLTYIFGGLLELYYLPSRLYTASQLHYASSITGSHIELAMLVFQIGLHVLMSAILWFQAEPLVRWIAAGLAGVENDSS